jgi:hypothetical protein
LTGVDRSADLSVNWGATIKVHFPSTSAAGDNNAIVGAVSVDLPFRAGTNTLTISNPQAWAPDFDSIIVAE